ncbi:MAG: TolC family protein [Candidatus Tectimicrobiota bacterium]
MNSRRGPRPDVSFSRVFTLMLIGLSLSGAGVLLTSSAGQAQQREMLLSLREATAYALQSNLEIQIAGLNPAIREAQITERQGIFDVVSRATLRASDSRLLDTATGLIERTNVGGGLVSQDNSQEQRLAVGINQLVPTGGTYDVEIAESHLSTTRRTTATELKAFQQNRTLTAPFFPFHPRNDFYTTEATLRATQPLLRNFGSEITKTQIVIAQNNLNISKEDFRRQVILITSRVQQAYWDLVFRRQDLEVRQQQLILAQKLLDQIRKQVAVGTLAPLDVLQAETNIARTEERILVADNALRAAEDRLKRVMNFSLYGDLANVILIPVDPPTYNAPTLDQQTQIQQALEQRPDLIQAKLTLENQNITLVFDKNQTLPALDLEGSFRLNGIDKNFEDNFSEIEVTKRYRWEVGLTFRYPLANRQAKSRVQQSQLAIRQQMIRIKDLEENIVSDVRNALRDVLTNAQRVQATRISSRLAQKQLEAEEKKLQVGLATVFTTLQFQDVLAVERSNGINAITEYLKALVRLEEVKSTLLQSYSIVLEPAGARLQ